jgi:hypothetical protein
VFQFYHPNVHPSIWCPTFPIVRPTQRQWKPLRAYCAWLSDHMISCCVSVWLCNYPWQAGIPTNTMCKVHSILNYTPYWLLHAPHCMWLQHVSMLIHCVWRILLPTHIRIVWPGVNKKRSQFKQQKRDYVGCDESSSRNSWVGLYL